MAEKNEQGLGRYVPQEVRREIRSRCGFGCVICGLAYYDYEHFDPDFKDAKIHDPKGMTLLCMQCNQKRARGTLSAQTVARANADPKCKQQGFASELFDFSPDPIEISFAGSTFRNCRHLIRVNGVDILSVRPPEEAGSPMLLSGFFSDATGATTLKIEDNVWSAGDDNWDVEVVGPRITIRRALGDIALQIKVDPPHALTVERIDMEIEGFTIRGDQETFQLLRGDMLFGTYSNCSAEDVHIGINIS